MMWLSHECEIGIEVAAVYVMEVEADTMTLSA